MKKDVIYTYLGENGTISSSVLLEGIYHITKIRMTADKGKILTDGKVFRRQVSVSESDVDLWKEVPEKGQI